MHFLKYLATSLVLTTVTLLDFVIPAHAASLLVGSFNNNSVLRYDGKTGTFIDTFVAPGSGGLAGPTALTIAPDGNLYVDSLLNSSVLRYNGQTGKFIDAFVPGNSPGVLFLLKRNNLLL